MYFYIQWPLFQIYLTILTAPIGFWFVMEQQKHYFNGHF